MSTQKANVHLTHIEDLVITNGSSGIDIIRDTFIDIFAKVKAEMNWTNITVKYDGSPSVFCGIHQESGKFFVGTKGVLSKIPKLCFTNEDIELYYSSEPELEFILKQCLRLTSKCGICNILQGDVMFTSRSKKIIDDNLYFSTNTITYSVPAESRIGKQIIASELGIVFHTSYDNANGGSIKNMVTSPSPCILHLNKPDGLWLLPVTDIEFYDTHKLDESIINELESVDVSLKNYVDSISASDALKFQSFLVHLSKYNLQFELPDIRELAIDFISSKFSSEKKKQEIKNFIDSDQFSEMLKLINKIVIAKNKIMDFLNSTTYIKTFYENSKQELIPVSNEGFVVVNKHGSFKLVDRYEFSRLNFVGE